MRIDEVTFKRPVDVGDLLRLRSWVVTARRDEREPGWVGLAAGPGWRQGPGAWGWLATQAGGKAARAASSSAGAALG